MFGNLQFTPTTTTTQVNGASRRTLKEENAMEELRVMLHQESIRYSNTFDYLSLTTTHEDSLSNNERVSEGWRRKICEWSFEVVDHFGFDREVVSIALSFLDRVVALKTKPSGEPMHRREFQLIAVTCLYLAIKLHGETDTFDGPRRKLKIHAFVELSRGLFTVETLEAKEREILEMLEWKVNPPTTVRIVATLLRLLPEWTVYENVAAHSNTATAIYEMARYLTELAVCVSTFSFKFNSSEIAYASILCAMEALQNKVHIPYGVRIEFLNKITEATKLTPHGVNSIRVLLMELCPAMFPSSETNTSGLARQGSVAEVQSSANDGKVSPVCVMSIRDVASPRKRGRQSS
jgi:hypothetical protein